MKLSDIDRSELISESYRIEGIHISECRSIFLDWALKLRGEYDQGAALDMLIATYVERAPEHPMSTVLRESQGRVERRGRRGGSRGRNQS